MNITDLKYSLLAQVKGRPLRRQPAEQLRDGNAAAAWRASAVEQHRQLGQLQPACPTTRHHQGQQLQRHIPLPRPRGQHGQQQEHREALQNRQERQKGCDVHESENTSVRQPDKKNCIYLHFKRVGVNILQYSLVQK